MQTNTPKPIMFAGSLGSKDERERLEVGATPGQGGGAVGPHSLFVLPDLVPPLPPVNHGGDGRGCPEKKFFPGAHPGFQWP